MKGLKIYLPTAGRGVLLPLLAVLFALGLLQGCASGGGAQAPAGAAGPESSAEAGQVESPEPPEYGQADRPLKEIKKEREVKALNEKIAMESFTTEVEQSDTTPDREGYQVGPGDVLEIAVFQVEELNRKVRVTGDGFIMIPLLGGVQVAGKTVSEIENILTQKLGAEYLQDPQVSVFVAEFKSHQVAVMGAVKEPSIYSIERPRTVLEMLARAGGLTEKAGTQVQVRRASFNKETGKPEKETLIMDIKALLMSGDQRLNVVLKGGDSIVVPEAGSVFVEGAVVQPGAYELRGDTTVLKALSMAGGIVFETEKQAIEVYRDSLVGEDQVFQVDYDEIKQNPSQDIVLQEGDIVVVPHSSVKRGMANFWKGISGIFRIGL